MEYVIDGDRVSYFDDYFFQKPMPMPDAHGRSFRQIAKWLGADDERVYFMYKAVDADPASLVCLGGYHWYWARDRASAYAFSPTKAAVHWKVLKSRRVDAFHILPDAPFASYAGDGEKIFRDGREVRGADAASFRIATVEEIDEGTEGTSHHFTFDRHRIYYEGKPIKRVDEGSFRIVSSARANNTEFLVDGVNAIYKDWFRSRMMTIPQTALPAFIQDYLRDTDQLQKLSPAVPDDSRST